MRKRTGKFYFNNEKDTLSKLGLTPTPGSGSGWIIKEDGENDLVMVQLKSTDSSSYRIDMMDIKKLEYHAQTSNKVPIFLIQFLRQDKIYAIVNIDNIADIYNAFELNIAPDKIKISSDSLEAKNKIISSKNSRNKFYEDREKSFVKKRKKGGERNRGG